MDTGESTADIVRRGDDRAWTDVLADLQAGIALQRPAKLRDYYTIGGKGRCLSASRVKRLESHGVLVRAGVDAYALADGWMEALAEAAKPAPKPPVADTDQLELSL